jgi:hypothetical protein
MANRLANRKVGEKHRLRQIDRHAGISACRRKGPQLGEGRDVDVEHLTSVLRIPSWIQGV